MTRLLPRSYDYHGGTVFSLELPSRVGDNSLANQTEARPTVPSPDIGFTAPGMTLGQGTEV